MADQIDLMSVKIARPLVHLSYRFGQFSKIEGVFVPWFEPYRLAGTGDRWVDSRVEMLTGLQLAHPWPANADMFTIDYAQAGIRFTTTVGSSDIGVQYYYGRTQQPSVGVEFDTEDNPQGINIVYSPYHQIGLDYAQVLLGFNIRAELAANLTENRTGYSSSVYSPSLLWSFGFDRDLFWGINLNLQVNQSIILFYNELASSDLTNFLSGYFDIGEVMQPTSTRITAAFSKKFFREELEIRAAVVWGVEDNDCAILPALVWTKDSLRAALSFGIFVGDTGGQLGQYKDNNFLKVSLTYTF
jgi:hypothetical protein